VLSNLPLSCFLAALAIGVVAEATAKLFGLWTYRSRAFLFLNILITFGLVQGLGVGWVIGGRQVFSGIAPVLFMVGAVMGILVEGLNDYWWHGWSWSDRPFLGIERAIDKAAFVGVAWGFVPVLSVALARLAVNGEIGG
jgi:hypothetical protein